MSLFHRPRKPPPYEATPNAFSFNSVPYVLSKRGSKTPNVPRRRPAPCKAFHLLPIPRSQGGVAGIVGWDGRGGSY